MSVHRSVLALADVAPLAAAPLFGLDAVAVAADEGPGPADDGPDGLARTVGLGRGREGEGVEGDCMEDEG